MKIKRISDGALVFSDTKGVTAAASTPDPDAPRPVFERGDFKIYRNTDNLTGVKVVSAPADPLVAAARNGGKITPTTVKREPYNINAFGANMNAGKRAGDVLGAAVTGGIGNAAEAVGQVTQSTGLTIGENARLAAQGKGAQEEVMKAENEKADRIRENIKDPLYNLSDKMQAQSQQYTEAAKEGLGKVGQFLTDVAIGGTQLVGDIALGAVNPALGTAALGVRAFGGSAQQARQAGATETQQQLYGLGSAAVSMGIEKLAQVGKLFKKAYGGGAVDIDNAIAKLTSKLMKNEAGQKVLAGFIGEGSEEAIEAILDPLLRTIYDRNAIPDTIGSKEALTDYIADVGYSLLVGGTLGAVGGGGDVFLTKAPTEAQNTPPNAVASRTELTEGNNAPAPQNGTGASVGANENGLISLSDKEKSNLSSGVKNKIVSTFQEAVQFVKNAISDRTNTDRAYLGKVPDSVAQRVKQETGVDVAGMGVMMNGDNIRHILKKHGDPLREAAKNQIPVTAEAIARIPEIISNPDSVSLSDTVDGKGRQVIVFEKQFGDTYITIQGVSTGKKLLQTDTMYIKKEKPRMTQFSMPDANSNTVPEINAQDALPQRLSTDNVAQAAPVVKRDVFAEDVRNRAQNPSIGAADAGFDQFSALENKYGAIDGKARSIRPDDVPRSITGEDRVSETISTVKGAAATPDDFVPILETEAMKGEFSFMPITNNETVQETIDLIEKEGFPRALTNWTADVRNGKASAETIVMGQLLYNSAVHSGDTQLALDILADYQQMGRSAARALQAMSIMQKLTPESRLHMIRRSVRSMVDALGTDVKITIPAELEQQYLAAQSDAEADAVLDEIAKKVAEQIPTTLPKILTTLRYTNMLFNLKTQVRNVAGNVGMYGVSGVKNAVATALQRMSNKAENTRSLIVDPAYRKAGKDDFKNVERIVLRDGKYQEGSVEADDFKRNVENAVGVNQTGNRFVDIMLTPLQKANTATQWMMNNTVFGDYAFARGNYARALGGYLKAQGITPEQWSDTKWQEDNKSAVRKAREFAIKDAQENTFRDSNKLSDWISRIGRRENTPKAVRALSEGLAPFRRTPANILLRAEEYSPLGIFNTAVKAAQSAKGGEEVTANDVTEQLAKTLTGTGLFLLGMLGAMRGVLRGAEDDDEQQAAFDDLRGHQPYSIEIGDKSYTLDWLTPASMPLFMGVELANGLAENGLTISDIESALTSIAEPMLEMSMMSGAKDALDNIQYSDNNLIQLALNLSVSYLTQIFTSTLGGQIERTFEPNRMTTYVDKNKGMSSWMQYALGKASAKGIGEYGQTEYIDAWGRTESNGNFGQRAFNNFLAPWYSSTVSNDPLEAEIQRLYNATGENVFPERPEKYFTVDGERVDLTAEQYTEYATKRGNELYNLMQKVVDSSAYKKASDSGKAEMLTDAKTYADKKAKAEIGYNDADSWATKVDNIGIDPSAYIQYMLVTDGLTADKDANGKTISGSKKEKVMAKINSLNISKSQKDALYRLEGYSESTISDAPWR